MYPITVILRRELAAYLKSPLGYIVAAIVLLLDGLLFYAEALGPSAGDGDYFLDADIAIIDLVLEQGSGISVVRKCRCKSADGKIVVFSDYVTPGIHRHCLGLGADRAISKSDMHTFIDYCSGLTAAG